MKKIYLAGPDVFRENAPIFFNQVKQLCKKYGFAGLSPFDSETNDFFVGELFSKQHSIAIFKGNVNIIEKCDAIFANLVPFRGACVDDGTSFEIGYGYANKKLIYGYTENYNKKLEEVTVNIFKESDDFINIEKFGDNCVNLMLQESIELSGGKILRTLEDCLKDFLDSEAAFRF